MKILEAAPGFEPGMKVLQTSALPLGYAASNLPNGRPGAGRLAIEEDGAENGI